MFSLPHEQLIVEVYYCECFICLFKVCLFLDLFPMIYPLVKEQFKLLPCA